MKIGSIILCRYNSSRIPGKILKDIGGKPPLQHLHEKFAPLCPEGCLVIGTSQEPTDDVIEQFCIDHGYQCFRGHLENLTQRFLNAAKAYDFDYAVRLNADALFNDVGTYQEMLALCRTGQYDFITNIKERTFPVGITLEIIKISFLESLQPAMQAELRYRHYPTLYLYDHPEVGRQHNHRNTICPKFRGLHLALDHPKDLELFRRMMAKLKNEFYTCSLKRLEAVVNEVKREYEQEGKLWDFVDTKKSIF